MPRFPTFTILCALGSCLPAAAQAAAVDIFVKDNTALFKTKSVQTTSGTQDLTMLFPDDPGANNKDQSDVIKWSWKTGPASGWSVWSMALQDTDKANDFFAMVGQPDDLRKGSAAAAKEFEKRAGPYYSLLFCYPDKPINLNTLL